jgi:ribulose 1,5-bisphosphate synthetase/thiazole synthase
MPAAFSEICGAEYLRGIYMCPGYAPANKQDMTVDTAPRVIICGGGPVGFFVALKLSRANIPCLILERV